MKTTTIKEQKVITGKDAARKIGELLNSKEVVYPITYITRGRTSDIKVFKTPKEAMSYIFPIKNTDSLYISAYRKGWKPFIEVGSISSGHRNTRSRSR